MITITRRTARQVRAVFRRALGATRGAGPAVSFCVGPGGLSVRVRQGGAAVEYHEPGDHPPQELTTPFEFLADCEAGKDDPVQLQRDGDTGVVATWNDGGIPQIVRYDTQGVANETPGAPDVMANNPRRLVTALQEATDTADREAVRYALNAIQLQGAAGRIIATDGRQLLVASGFVFPWEDDVHIPRNTVFASREFAGIDDVAIGKTDQWVALRIGPWTTWLETVKDAKFPRVMDHIPRADDAKTVVRISESDATFLSKSLKHLPCDDSLNQPVTIDANGSVAVRSQAPGRQPTELVLTNSTVDGEATRLNTNRSFLSRVVKLGFRDMRLYGPETPAYCCDEHRSYVWAVLGKDGVITPSSQCVRIESPQVGEKRSRNQSNHKENQPQMTTNRISQPDGGSNGRHSNNGSNESVSVDSLIETAEGVKASLRESVSQVSELITALKRHRKQSKTLHSALSSIRALQAIDA